MALLTATGGSPNIIQAAYGRSNANQTLTLGAAPTVGHGLLLLIVGFSGAMTPPAGFTTLFADAGATEQYKGCWLYYRDVVAGDPTSYALTAPSDFHMSALFEIDTVTIQGIITDGAGTVSGTTFSTGALTAPATPSSTIRLLVFVTDNSNSLTPPSGGTLLSPSNWQSTGNNQNGAIFSVPATTSGVQTVTLATTTAYQLWADLKLAAGAPPPLRITQATADVWATNPSPPVRASFIGADAWVTNPASPLRISYVGTDVWVDMAKPVLSRSSAQVFFMA